MREGLQCQADAESRAATVNPTGASGGHGLPQVQDGTRVGFETCESLGCPRDLFHNWGKGRGKGRSMGEDLKLERGGPVLSTTNTVFVEFHRPGGGEGVDGEQEGGCGGGGTEGREYWRT